MDCRHTRKTAGRAHPGLVDSSRVVVRTCRILLFAMSFTSSVLEVAKNPEFSTSSTLSCTCTHAN